MKRYLLIYLALILGIAGTFGQQMTLVPISLFDRALPYYNPAATGMEEALTASLFYRSHITGMEGAPSALFFTANAPLKNYRMALGVKLEHESVGSRNFTGFFFDYAYRMRLGSNTLAFALEGGIYSGSIDLVTLRDPSDLTWSENTSSSILPNFGVGALYYGKIYWISFSVPRLLGYETKESGEYGIKVANVERDFIFAGGGRIKLNEDFDIEPSALMLFNPGTKLKYNINALGVYRQRYKAGIGYKSIQALVFILTFDINRQTSLAYSYDLNLAPMSNLSSSSHEIHFQYTFGYTVNANNPRGF
jgi:type IX secretion system PorP/SprF family membrane protein